MPVSSNSLTVRYTVASENTRVHCGTRGYTILLHRGGQWRLVEHPQWCGVVLSCAVRLLRSGLELSLSWAASCKSFLVIAALWAGFQRAQDLEPLDPSQDQISHAANCRHGKAKDQKAKLAIDALACRRHSRQKDLSKTQEARR